MSKSSVQKLIEKLKELDKEISAIQEKKIEMQKEYDKEVLAKNEDIPTAAEINKSIQKQTRQSLMRKKELKDKMLGLEKTIPKTPKAPKKDKVEKVVEEKVIEEKPQVKGFE